MQKSINKLSIAMGISKELPEASASMVMKGSCLDAICQDKLYLQECAHFFLFLPLVQIVHNAVAAGQDGINVLDNSTC